MMLMMSAFVPILLLPFLLLMIDPCVCFSATVPRRSTPVLFPSEAGDPVHLQFDVGCVANPVVLLPSSLDQDSKWQMYYYGNAGSWNHEIKCFLPTGWSGLAESDDGLTWTKIPGSHTDGSVLGPSEDDWDCVQTGVSDVVRINSKESHMFYFGADKEEIAMGPGSIAGFRMRIGRAKSYDQGRTWIKDKGYLLDYDSSEGLFASWPRIMLPQEKSDPWSMLYHAFDGQKWRVFGAKSTDQGDSWTRTGLVLEGGTSEDAFDFGGIGTRTVTPWRDGWLMIYEGVAKSGTHCLGAAYCDKSLTSAWTKLNDGKPILEPGKGPMGDWCSQVIGTPFVVALPDQSLRLYHCGKDGPDGKMRIGVVESKSGDISPESWKAI